MRRSAVAGARRSRRAGRRPRRPSGCPRCVRRRTAIVASSAPSSATRATSPSTDRHSSTPRRSPGAAAWPSTSAYPPRLRIVELRIVSEASFSFGTTSRSSSDGTQPGVGEPDLLDDPSRALDLDLVAEPQRLRERDQDPGDRVADRALAREPDHEREHCRRGEHAAGDRAHLRDHEQRREDADEDDRHEQRAADHAVAGDRPPAAGRAGRSAGRRTSRSARRHDHGRGDQGVLPELGHQCSSSSPQSIGFRPANPSS